VEFTNARSNSQEEFNEKISEWVSDKKEHELITRFIEIKSFDNKEDFEKIIRAIFHLANQPTKLQPIYYGDLVGYLNKDLIDKLSNYNDTLVKKFYSFSKGEETIKEFINRLFDQAKSPFYFESDLIRSLNREVSDSSILNKIELKKRSLDYLERYCKGSNQLDSNIWRLFRNCTQSNWVDQVGGSSREIVQIPKEANLIIKEFILNKDLDGYLLEIIRIEPRNKATFALSNETPDIFGSWELFIKDITDNSYNTDSRYLKEFLSFLSVLNPNNYSQFVAFEFKTIPVNSLNQH
jgi:hypothetical protein